MDDLLTILISLSSSFLGGLVAGLFTFLGVKLTIKNENKIKKQDIKDKNKETNKQIIANRPQFQIVENNENIKDEIEIFILPYNNPKLIDKDTIIFDYDTLKLDNKFWDFYYLVIENIGKQAIQSSFLQLDYKSGANIYSKYELQAWKQIPWAKNYYSDRLSIRSWILPNEQIKLKVFYPKIISQLKNIPLNIYMYDESNNYWHQEMINCVVNNKSEVISANEYIMNYKEDYNQWFTYEHMYYSKNIKKCFNNENMHDILEKRKKECWAKEENDEQFKRDVKNGDVLLNS